MSVTLGILLVIEFFWFLVSMGLIYYVSTLQIYINILENHRNAIV